MGKSKCIIMHVNWPQINCPRTVFSLDALLEAYLKSERYNQIGDLFRELPTKLSIEPDIVSYNTAIKALCKVGSLDLLCI